MSQDKPEFLLERHPSPVAPAERERLLQDPGFGRIFTDHMATVRYNADRGWHDAKIEARADLRLNPSTLVLHYAQEIFEGLKAYRLPDGSATLFRPQANARRFRNSAARLAMAELPEAVFVESVEQLVRLERDWIPSADGASLYLRPFMIATEVALGTKPSADYLYAVIASPVGAYFKGAVRPSRSGCRITTRAPRPAAPVRPSAAAITPPACRPRPKARAKDATRWCSSMRSSAAGSRSWVA
ncbi:putative branched-chain-amino-acid aminotransferase [Bordetella holmesii ATCC 51541]|nr:putative branched-chain-amino-acid aminotransferase [Bordetella holmesii ATCC 51541]